MYLNSLFVFKLELTAQQLLNAITELNMNIVSYLS